MTAMKTKKIILFLILSLSISSCQQIDKSATLVASPSAILSNNYQQVISYWGTPILSIYDGTGKNPKFYISAISQSDDLKRVLLKVDKPEKLSDVDLSKNILIVIEWGMYFSGGIKVEVTDVKINNNQAEIIVETYFPDPKIAQAAVFSSALNFITISRKDFDTKKPAKFVLINKGVVVSTISVEVH